MSSLLPNEFTINGDLVVRLDRDSMLLLTALIIFIIIVAFAAQRFLKRT
jgi:hypothetical protein